MPLSGRQRLSSFDLRREQKEFLLGVESAHRADIQTYSSGHLGPSCFSPQLLLSRPVKPIWEGSKGPCKPSPPSCLRERKMTEVHVEEMTDALYSFTMSTTLQEPQTQAGARGPVGGHPSKATELAQQQTRAAPDAMELFPVKPGPSGMETEQRPLATPSRRDELRLRRLFDRQVLRTRDLAARKSTSVEEPARRHERRLQQELSRLAAHRGPVSERLSAFSRVFSDVCDDTPAFSGALREIKTEYELYLDSVLSNQSSLHDMSAFDPLKDFLKTTKLDEATQQVCSLEEKARAALQENDRVRTEYEEAQARTLESQTEERRSEGPHLGQSGLTAVDVENPDLNQNEATISSVAQLEPMRHQVWRVWKEVQELQKEIRETMVSTVTTNAMEGCIRDTKAEIMRLIASNEHLRSANKALEQNILTVMNRAKVSEETKVLHRRYGAC
ncbi:uncharacterized protein C6orf118 isoform X2 [Electrophorus electricus]|uniref:uncharacterized protein C6orf118 isoform X2 n=1 Tax=Electrophorus electricus TaxID=8005 RepID=UPI0015D09625|nr:uncharacterized protein C6orf118 isoform X2 [Electrophorus electricus]